MLILWSFTCQTCQGITSMQMQGGVKEISVSLFSHQFKNKQTNKQQPDNTYSRGKENQQATAQTPTNKKYKRNATTKTITTPFTRKPRPTEEEGRPGLCTQEGGATSNSSNEPQVRCRRKNSKGGKRKGEKLRQNKRMRLSKHWQENNKTDSNPDKMPFWQNTLNFLCKKQSVKVLYICIKLDR